MICPFCGQVADDLEALVDHEQSCDARAAYGRHGRRRRPHRDLPWAVVSLTWTQTTTTVVPLDPSERKVTVIVTDVSFSDSSSGESGTLSIKDTAGATITPTNAPTWESDDDGEFIVLTPADDGMSASAVPAVPAAAGTANITITATHPDGTVLTFVTAVTVTAGDGAVMSISWAPIAPAAPPAPTPDPDPAAPTS